MYYTESQIIQKVKQLEGYQGIPQEYWLCFIRINEADQKPNEFNDVVYLMKGQKIVLTSTCTTTPGLPALRGGFRKYNKAGAAVLKANIWMNKSFSSGLHNGRMKCLRQVKDLYAYRDNDLDDVAEQLGKPTLGMWHTNIHAATYDF